MESGNIREWIGLGVAILLGLAFITLLLSFSGRQAGLSKRQIWTLTAKLWLAVSGAVGALLVVRMALAGPWGDYSVSGGIVWRELSLGQWVALGGGVLVAGGCLLWARRVVNLMARDGAEVPIVPAPSGDEQVWPPPEESDE